MHILQKFLTFLAHFYFRIYRKYVFNNYDYEVILSYSAYAPWNSDKAFQAALKIAQKKTLVDRYRLFGIWELITQTNKLQSGDYIEIGSYRGGSALLIGKAMKENKISNNFFICDTFQGVVKASEKDASYKGGEFSDTSEKIVEDFLTTNAINNFSIHKGIFPEDTGKDIESKLFRFCHIDVDVYKSVEDVINWIWPKMVSGGVIVIDDYGACGCNGVTEYINSLKQDQDKIIYYNLSGHAVITKR